MRKSLLATIAGAALIAGGALAAAQQRMEDLQGGANGAQNSSQREPRGAVHERQSGTMKGPAQGRAGAVEEKEHRSGQSGTMQGPAPARSGAVEEKGQRSGQSGTMQGPAARQSGRSVGSTTLSPDQRTKLHETIVSGGIHRVDHVDFSLSVGIRVPHTVTVYDVPERIVHIVPQYRGFKYIAVRNELAIIDSGTHKVVALLPMQGSVQERSGRSVGSTTLSPDQKTRLHGIITGGNVRRIDDVDFSLSVGTRVPDTVTVYDVPETIVDIVPEYRGFRYIVVEDELVIIDPETLEIVAVLPA
jgi:hypothetical protein